MTSVAKLSNKYQIFESYHLIDIGQGIIKFDEHFRWEVYAKSLHLTILLIHYTVNHK